MTKTFNTAAEARNVGAALFAAGRVSAWCDYRHFGKFIIRIHVNGRWSNLTATKIGEHDVYDRF